MYRTNVALLIVVPDYCKCNGQDKKEKRNDDTATMQDQFQLLISQKY